MATIATSTRILRSAAVHASRRCGGGKGMLLLLPHNGNGNITASTSSLLNVSVPARHMTSIVRAAPTWRKKPPSKNPCGGEMLLMLASINPFKDAVRFDWKNQKLSYGAMEYNAMALATGLAELGFEPGDTVLSWLPQHFQEQVNLQFACSKTGTILYTLDPAMAIKDPVKARQALHNALHLCKANVLMTQDAADDVYYVGLVERVIPETRIFGYQQMMPFVTPRFPHLRLTIHTGWDSINKEGFYTYMDMMVPAEGLLDDLMYRFTLDADTPLMGRFIYNDEGLPIGIDRPLTNKEVLKNREWPIYSSILRQEYQNVEGKGVVFY